MPHMVSVGLEAPVPEALGNGHSSPVRLTYASAMATDRHLLQQCVLLPHIQAALHRFARVASAFTSASRVSLLLVGEGIQARVAAAKGVPLVPGQSVIVGPGLAAEVIETRLPVLVQDLEDAPFPSHPERGYASRSCMAAPVLWDNHLYGVLCASDPMAGGSFVPEQLSALRLLADQVGASIYAFASMLAEASIDSLTGLQTRGAFERRLSTEVERARRFAHPVSLLLVNADNLRKLNDTEGPWVGDQVLRQIARAILETVRTVDLVARLGDDEFAIILPETAARESIRVARRVAINLHGMAQATGRSVHLPVRASVGAATLPPAPDAESLLEQAHRAMHMARSDRDSVRHWDLADGEGKFSAFQCSCRMCGRLFSVESIGQQQDRRYCSNSCAAAARRRVKLARNLEIAAQREAGMSLREIAERYGLTAERVRQICENG